MSHLEPGGWQNTFLKHKGIMEELPACHEYLDSLDGSGCDNGTLLWHVWEKMRKSSYK